MTLVDDADHLILFKISFDHFQHTIFIVDQVHFFVIFNANIIPLCIQNDLALDIFGFKSLIWVVVGYDTLKMALLMSQVFLDEVDGVDLAYWMHQ